MNWCMIQEKIACIQKWMLTIQSRLKSYADMHCRVHKVAVSDLVYPQVSHMWVIWRFGI
jgi:hypothetical protein